ATVGADRGIWIHDLARGTLVPVVRAGSAGWPVWTPDGQRIVFAEAATGSRNVFWALADGSGKPERLASSEFTQFPASMTAEGRTVLFVQVEPTTSRDIWMLPVNEQARTARPLLNSKYNEAGPDVSPDGQWLAYVSD